MTMNKSRARRTACKHFNAGSCFDDTCAYSHTLIDISRIGNLVDAVLAQNSNSRVSLAIKYRDPSGTAPDETWIVALQVDVFGRDGDWTDPTSLHNASPIIVRRLLNFPALSLCARNIKTDDA
ncbi:hypothetical protein PHLCEN_2v2933 [Hermanssonia centrifuga]|uniref:C3H1-type domain-containing protein n=1 Tax=Hermanssonia centrifuga TaxID=98765 RepID=A0A2R6RIE6_9APHY|nr:hypothetical protein PHLCEN_2v2933 [Hermanssonia centrifuga]